MMTQYLKLPAGRLAYDDQGSGPLVICVPSMGDLRGEYRFLAPQLVSAGRRVITLDVRGHGETNAVWPDYSVGAIGQDLIDLTRALDAGPAIIVGTSMAAGAAVWAAAEAPEWVAGLFLIGPFVRGETNKLMKLVFSLMAARPWGPALWRSYYTSLYPTRKPSDFPMYTAALSASLNEPGRLEALRQMLIASKAASAARLGAVQAPAQVLMGAKDPDFPQPEAEARWVAEQLRGAYTLLPGAGHYPHAEMPEETGRLVLDFLDKLVEKAGPAHAA